MRFTIIKDVDNKLCIELHKCMFGENIIDNNGDMTINNIFKDKNVNISGSSILHLYNKFMLNDYNAFDINDIDIYYSFTSFRSSNKLFNFIITLMNFGYLYKKTKTIASGLLSVQRKLKNLFRMQIRNRLVGFSYYNKNTNKYFSLSGYIVMVLNFTNPTSGKKIDVILIHSTIQQMILNSFDFNIIKNYYCYGELRINNVEEIYTKRTKMSLSHLYKRSFNNIYELYNFIKRVKKYTERGYTIYIENNEINSNFISKILKLLLVFYGINYDYRNDYKYMFTHNKLYTDKNAKDHLMHMYYNTFYMNEELMVYVYNPRRLFNIYNDYLLDDY